ncbi:MAG: hypothetical protein EAZ06_12045 [Cytophagales bacterium]|nr:MAG: hypothetical protein EAZ06_12045 [Cytophagales bacterium]
MRLFVKIIYLFIFLMGISLCLEAQVRKIIVDKNKAKKDSIQKIFLGRSLALKSSLDSLKNK